MTPEYLEQLADIADPHKLWRKSGLERLKFTPEQKLQIDTGVALRRHADYLRRLARALEEKRSYLVTPLSSNSSASKFVTTPAEHQRLRWDADEHKG